MFTPQISQHCSSRLLCCCPGAPCFPACCESDYPEIQLILAMAIVQPFIRLVINLWHANGCVRGAIQRYVENNRLYISLANSRIAVLSIICDIRAGFAASSLPES